jgi:hypothetical protein
VRAVLATTTGHDRSSSSSAKGAATASGPAAEPPTAPAPVDVFACNSTLGNLLRFVRGAGCGTNRGQPLHARFLVERVGPTVFFLRRERSPTETIPDVRGYGHAFPEAYTTWERDVRGSLLHTRVVRYAFAGLQCLVRFNSDGYLRVLAPGVIDDDDDDEDNKGDTRAASTAGDKTSDNVGNAKGAGRAQAAEATAERLLASLARMDVGSKRSLAASNDPAPSEATEARTPPLTVRTAGARVPQAAVFDLKTRWGYYAKDEDGLVAQEMARLWLAQIPNFIVAYNTSGVFDDIRVRDVRPKLAAWEEANADALRKFAVLVKTIVDLARDKGDGGKLEVRLQGGGDDGAGAVAVVEVREQVPGEGFAALSDETKAEWVDLFSRPAAGDDARVEGDGNETAT